jgi:hypothetical protein
MMKRLELDFRAGRRGSPWIGRALLAAAVAVCADAGWTYKKLHEVVTQNEIRVAKRSPAAALARVSAPELAAVRETVQRLTLPWEELFAALESAATDQVTLASIEPDMAKGTVTISGDGKDYLAALSYVSNLGQSGGLERVQLVRHERKAADPNGPVSFAVTAAWSGK